MLVTAETNRRNRYLAVAFAASTVLAFAVLGWFYPWCWLGLVSGPLAYWWMRRGCRRRMRVMAQPFPRVWDTVLRSRVTYFNALNETQKDRFRQLVKIFLDETRITGIRTDVDETTRVLVAASAIIPIFNFDQWEYSRLGEVLIYPGNFDANYQTDADGQNDTLGMVGVGHLSGVMILSKPALVTGFDIAGDKRNVGIHEFAHLVDRADGAIDGIPPGVSADLARMWTQWVAKELADPPTKRSHINPYGYTNEAEYFAVLLEYFFEAPGVLQQKNPQVYAMLEKMIRQDTAAFLSGVTRLRARRIGRNNRCPCGSGKKYKKCCLPHARQGLPA
ncbi:MAG TPA: zinc-dependent peptidase [Thermoguttaceae bacterium]|nr:zinc-dependent peptidase [Thermoguttaceae bacterium]